MSAKMMAAWLLIPMFAWAQTVEVRADRDSHVYRCGDSATFTVRVAGKDRQPLTSGQLRVVLTNFGTQQVAQAVFDLAKANPVTCVGTLREPGFLKCTAVAKLDKTEIKGLSGVAYEPEKIVAGSPRPADFDAFWDAAIARLESEVPLDPRVERFDRYCTDKHDAFKVSFATFDGLRVYGFLSVPKGPGPFPVEINVPGAGPGVIGPNVGMADRGFIHLVMNVHPFEPAADADSQKKRYAEQDLQVQARYGVKRYCQAGAAQRETYFYYRIMLGINRAVNWVAARPDVDRTRFAYTGSSQGGGFGFYLLGLNRHFTKGVVHVPAITDLLGFQKGRDSGWPKLIENMRESDKAAALKVAPISTARISRPASPAPCAYRSVSSMKPVRPPPYMQAIMPCALPIKRSDMESACRTGSFPNSMIGSIRSG